MKSYQVQVKGRQPLLHGRKDSREEEAPRGGAARDKWYAEQWRYTHYADKDGFLGQPAHILKAVMVAGLRETAKPGDIRAGKGVTKNMARACLRIEPAFPKFNGGHMSVPDDPLVVGPAEAQALNGDEPLVFVLKRLCDRGVEITNLGMAGWNVSFEVTIPMDPQRFFDDDDRLLEGLQFGFGIIGMGTWRPDFGIGEVVGFERL